MKVFSALYDFVLGLYGMTYLPKYFNKKYALRRHFKMPDIVKKTNGPLIWIHAVSVGETKAVSKLAKRLKEENFFEQDGPITVAIVSGRQPGITGGTDTIRVRTIE